MYKINISRIRDIIVQLEIRPTSIMEYDRHVVCKYRSNHKELVFDFTDEHVTITYEDGEKEYILINNIEYMNIVISYFASRTKTS